MIEEKDGDKVLIKRHKSLVEMTLNRGEKMHALDLHVLNIVIGTLKLVDFECLLITSRDDNHIFSGGEDTL